MSDRPEVANSAAVGRRRRRLGVGALVILSSTSVGVSIEAVADTIRLKSGEEIEGSIVDATRNTVIVRRSIGGMRQLPVQDIDEVRVDLARGKQISGQFLGWADGAYQLRSGGEEVRVSEGAVSRGDQRQATSEPPPEALPAPEHEPTAADTTTASAPSPPEEPAALAEAAAPVNPAEPEEPTAPAEPGAARAEGDGQALAVRGSVDPAEAGADGLVFKIELSRPSEQPVVLIYGTVDGTAKAGTDYEPQQGVITLAPGTSSGEVRVPLIEHQPASGDKRFELFLIADPTVAEVVDKRIIATIQGED